MESAWEQAKRAVGSFLFPQIPTSKPMGRGESITQSPGYKAAFSKQTPLPLSINLNGVGNFLSGVGSNIGGVVSNVTNRLSQPAVYKFNFRQPSAVPSPTPSSSAVPVSFPVSPTPVSTNNNFVFDFNTLKRNPKYATTGPRPGFQPQQPPANIGNLIRSTFPKEATTAALVASTENATFNPRRKDNINRADGSIDRGIFQINSNSFNGLMKRRGAELQAKGIFNFDDMWDPKKNIEVARMIYDEGGWGRWFGWQDTGYDINQGYYSQPARVAYEIALRGGKYKTK